MTRKPSAALIAKTRKQVERCDPDVQALILPLLDQLEARKRPGRKASVTKPGRDLQIAQAYQLLVDERDTVMALLREHDAPELHDWRDRLPSNRHQRYEEVARRFGLTAKTVQKIIDKNNKTVRTMRSKVTLGIE